MAEINKLSVGKLLDKLRSDDAQNTSRIMQLDEKIKTTEEEIQRLRTARTPTQAGPTSTRARLIEIPSLQLRCTRESSVMIKLAGVIAPSVTY